MALSTIFQGDDPSAVDFRKSEGTIEPVLRYPEPGMWWDCERKDLCDGFFCAVENIIDNLLAGTDPATGTWTVTVTPLTTRHGSAAADGMSSASISFTPDPGPTETIANVVLGLIQAAEDGANLLLPGDVLNWNRFRSYVELSVSPTAAEVLRASSVVTGATFSIEITPPAGNTATPTVISAPDSTTLNVGLYAAINRDKGTSGRTDDGKYYIKNIEASTPVADIIGPVYLGANTQPVESGYCYREYKQGSMVSFVHYGVPLAYGEAAIAATSIGGPVYVRSVADGDKIIGLAADAAAAAAAATAYIVTATPVPLDNTQYAVDVVIDGVLVGQLTALSDASATAIEIADVLRADLSAKGGFGGLVTADTAGASPVVFTGPADGRALDMTNGQTVAGDAGPIQTAGASKHILFSRDTFAANSTRAGSVPVNVPHP